MLSDQLKHALKRAVVNSPIAPAIRILRPARPLDEAIRHGRRFGWSQAAQSFLAAPFRDAPSVLNALREDINRDYEVELLFTEVRKQLLLNPPSAALHQELVAALIQQCANNEYVWFASEAEQHQLRQTLNGDDVAVRALYQPAHTLPGDVPGVVGKTLRGHRAEHAAEIRIKDAIPTFAPISDPTSMQVRAMYEAFPYPRWISLVKHAHELRVRWIREFFQQPLPILDGACDILMPGCGTGRKAIQMALAFPKANVLCTDLSRSSLAYMMRMARRYGVANIEPLQMDIYDLAASIARSTSSSAPACCITLAIPCAAASHSSPGCGRVEFCTSQCTASSRGVRSSGTGSRSARDAFPRSAPTSCARIDGRSCSTNPSASTSCRPQATSSTRRDARI
jgi:hypothetical protein